MLYFYDFLALFFPRICCSCKNTLLKHEDILCTFCLHKLPKTNFHQDKDNPVSKIFWGRIHLESASSMYFFTKGGKVQHLLHQLKYKGKKEIGVYLGNLYGKELKTSDLYKDVDVNIPVPVHPRKTHKRGYNQSEMFARGLSVSFSKPVDIKALIRTHASETQTKKSRFRRWENVEEIFALKNHQHLYNKHILLVDDVITTGATIEACGKILLNIQGVKLSVASIACALH
jgi:ComF family protein